MADKKSSNEEILERLRSSLKAFSDVTGIAVTTYDSKGEIAREYNEDLKLCSRLSVYSLRNGGCRKLLYFAGEFSSHLGEPYIFLCRAGFSNISVPIILSGDFKGYAVAGPFIIKKLRSSTVKNMFSMNRIDETEKDEIKSFIDTIPVFDSNRITDLSVLFYNCVLSALVPPSDYILLNKQNDEQRTISNKIRQAKNEALLSSTFTEDTEDELVGYILNNNMKEAEQLIRRTLDRFSVIAVGRLDDIKTMSLWATATIVKSLSDELSTRYGEKLDVDIDIINRITEADSLNELAQAFMYIVEHVSGDLVASLYTGSSLLVSHSLKYIKDHYHEKFNLKDMCLELHVNPTYFSYLFSREMDQTFVEYLTNVRLNKAADLLSSTTLSILDISVMTGFENQSYFTKVFRSKMGMTPREYRRQNEKTE